jgi:hypothetical protein
MGAREVNLIVADYTQTMWLHGVTAVPHRYSPRKY